jgi:4-amino-4-deoxy-L-arabinose transferase-like glycosyltransferase/putative flippase GtrA
MNIVAPSLSKLFSVTLGKFLTVGVINTAVTMAFIFTAKAWLNLGDIEANACGYVIGMLCSFLLNKFWTFSHKGNTLQAAARFILVCGFAYGINLLALKAFLSLDVNAYLCHILAMPFYTLVFYVGSKVIVFVKYSNTETGEGSSERRPWLANLKSSHHVFDSGAKDISRRNLFLFLFVLAVSAIVLLYRLTDDPIEIWDEARLANNALEMSKNGLSLITTYEWLPDHWNTKPPLLIWLMAISMNLVGINELGVRLPSVLASLGTVMLVYCFVGNFFRRPVHAFLAAMLILATPGYVQIHGARSGNYDALLTLLTTAYILSAFMFLEGPVRKKRMYFILTTVAVVLAFYTKTIQGLIFLPAIILYALLTKKIVAVLREPYFHIGCLLAVASCVVYYWFRNEIDPGYFSAVQANDLGGRYANALEGHHGSPIWYLMRFKYFPWLVPGFIMAAYILLRGASDLRRFILLITICSLFYFFVISSAGTKLVWYAIPIAPLSAIICALGLGDVAEKLRKGAPAVRWPLVALLGIAVGVPVVSLNTMLVHRALASKEAKPLDQHSFALRSLIENKKLIGPLVVLHPGYPVAPGFPFYVAPTLFYANVLTITGTPTTIVQHAFEVEKNATLLACGKETEVGARTVKIPLNSGADCALYVSEPQPHNHTKLQANNTQQYLPAP